MVSNSNAVESTWFAVCHVDELTERAIYHTELAGNELAVWRADDGVVNVWENRCPHRGVRLSLGHHRGDALQCQYHGWQFGAGTGVCRFVPAHPQAAAPAVAVTTWPVQVRYGLVWTCLTTSAERPAFAPIAELENGVDLMRLRTVAIDAASEAVQAALAGYGFDHADFGPHKAADCVAFDIAPHAVQIERLDDAAQRVVFILQPARGDRTYLHGVVPGPIDAGRRLAVQRHHQQRLNALRDGLEQQAAKRERALEDELAAHQPQRNVPDTDTLSTQDGFLQRAPARPVSGLSASLAVAMPRDSHAAAGRPFTVRLARSAQVLNVAAGVSLLQALRDRGVAVPSSCEQGVCGTCRTRVLEGTPLHRDDFLTPREKAAGDCMMVCVSRAATDSLTLDL